MQNKIHLTLIAHNKTDKKATKKVNNKSAQDSSNGILEKTKKQQAAYASIYPLFVAGVFYYVANLLLSLLFAYAERKLNYYK